MRQLLRDTGTPQVPDSRQIGPLPNLRAAIGSLLAGNRPPVCNNDSLTTPGDTLLSIPWHVLFANDSDPDGDNLWVTHYDFMTAQGGTNDCCHAGGFNYSPPAGFTGQDWFSYTISDRPDLTGLTDTCTVFVSVTPNQAPVARFAFTCSGLSCTFDSSTSTDDGLILSRSWSVGDTTFGSGVSASRTFAATGTYTVTLTVTDNAGQQGTISKKVSVTNASPLPAESYFAVTPCRLADTRSGPLLNGNQWHVFNVAGSCGVPATAKAVSFNVGVVSATGQGYLTFVPGDQSFGPFPNASLNFMPGADMRFNNAVLRLATNGAGTVAVWPAFAPQLHLVLDVYGYFSEDAAPAPGAVGPLGFQALQPCRALDTRATTPLTEAVSRSLTLQGVCGVPAGATAVAVSLAAVTPTDAGHVRVFPPDASQSMTPVRFPAGIIAQANGARTRLAATPPDLKLLFSSSNPAATSHAVVDVYGYFKSDEPLRYRPITPCRLLDTRLTDHGAPAFAGGEPRKVQVQGNCGVPVGAKAAVLNVTSVSPVGAGHLVLYPAGAPFPVASALNFHPDQGVALGNGVVIGVGSQPNDLTVPCGVSSTHLVIDVFGYFQ